METLFRGQWATVEQDGNTITLLDQDGGVLWCGSVEDYNKLSEVA